MPALPPAPSSDTPVPPVPPLIRVGQGSYQRDVAPDELSKADLSFLLWFAAGLLLGLCLAC